MHTILPAARTALALACCFAPAAAARAATSGPAAPLVIATVAFPGGGTALTAKIQNHQGLFLFDTGAGVTAVTPPTAKRAGCRPWGMLTGFRATGQRLDTPRCDDLRLTIAGRTFTSPIASVLDLDALVGPGGPPLSGLLALDIFAGRTITIRPLAHELVVETPSSRQRRIEGAREVPIRLVRDVEGVALSVDAAIDTSAGRAWMELDIGNLGPIMIGAHLAPLLGLGAGEGARSEADFRLSGGIPVRGPARVARLIMDGDVGETVLGRWDVTLDLAAGRCWFRPAAATRTPG